MGVQDGPPVYLDEAPVVLGSEEDESAVDLMVGAPDVSEENAFPRCGCVVTGKGSTVWGVAVRRAFGISLNRLGHQETVTRR